jgi:uncharacterized membrane protein
MSSPERIARDQGLLAAASTLGFGLGPVLGVLAYSADPLLPWLACLAIGGAAAIAIGVARALAVRGDATTPTARRRLLRPAADAPSA